MVRHRLGERSRFLGWDRRALFTGAFHFTLNRDIYRRFHGRWWRQSNTHTALQHGSDVAVRARMTRNWPGWATYSADSQLIRGFAAEQIASRAN